jgi:hypothetical protein
MIAASVTFQAAVGMLLFLMGHWGTRRALTLVPECLGEDERNHRALVLRRGGRACQVAGVIFVLMVVPLWL